MMSKLSDVELPVYKVSYELLLESFNLIKGVTREYKYTIGEKLKNEMTDLLMNVYRANKVRGRILKLRKVEDAIENIEVIRLFFRLLNDLHEISVDDHVRISGKIENVRRQLSGWEKHLSK